MGIFDKNYYVASVNCHARHKATIDSCMSRATIMHWRIRKTKLDNS